MKCPKCGKEMFLQVNQPSGEEVWFCPVCKIEEKEDEV